VGNGVGGSGVWVGSGIFVGVQVGGKTTLGVGVTVGSAITGGSVAGGKGFIARFGLIKIIATPRQTQTAITSTIAVRRFQIRPVLEREFCIPSSE
jgi:hypothetical protein